MHSTEKCGRMYERNTAIYAHTIFNENHHKGINIEKWNLKNFSTSFCLLLQEISFIGHNWGIIIYFINVWESMCYFLALFSYFFIQRKLSLIQLNVIVGEFMKKHLLKNIWGSPNLYRLLVDVHL